MVTYEGPTFWFLQETTDQGTEYRLHWTVKGNVHPRCHPYGRLLTSLQVVSGEWVSDRLSQRKCLGFRFGPSPDFG